MADLPELRRIAAEGGLRWRPEQTRHSGFSPQRTRSRLGALPPGGLDELLARERSAADGLVRFAAGPPGAGAGAVSLPKHVDWRDVDGKSYVTGVKDQSYCGSCVAFGTTAMLESMVRIAAGQPKLAVDLSEAHAFFCYGPGAGAGRCPDGGWWVDSALEAMRHGVVDEASYAYTADDQPCRRPKDWKSRLTRFASWTTLTTIAAMRRHLATVGPLTACFTIYQDFFENYSSGVWEYDAKTSGEPISGHCVQIVGYDDTDRYWIAKNSWGTWWGEDGYFRIAYGSAGIDADMWGIDGKVSSPLIRTRTRMVAVSGGDVWEATRRASGTWTGLTHIDADAATDPGAISAVSAATTINTLHVIGLVKGAVQHAARTGSGAWRPFAAPTSDPPKAPFTAVSCAAVGDTLRVVGIAGGSLWHTKRSAKGTWSAGWKRVLPAAQDPGTFTAVSLAAVGRSFHLTAVANGGPAHWVLKADGTWPASGTQIAAQVGDVDALGTAGVDGVLHVVALSGGTLWHAVRSTAGRWPEAFSAVPSTGASGFSRVACADVGRKLQVVGIAQGKLRHTYRLPSGTWRTRYADVAALLPSVPGDFSAVDCA